MGYTMRDVYGVMLKDYPDVMNIEEMSRALGVSTKTAAPSSPAAKRRP